jgi:hypothetical protein
MMNQIHTEINTALDPDLIKGKNKLEIAQRKEIGNSPGYTTIKRICNDGDGPTLATDIL